MIESVNIQPLPIQPLPIQPTTKLPQRQFLVLFLLVILLVMLLLIGQWFWLTHTLSSPEVPILLPAERAPLWEALFRQKAIVWSLLTSAGTMLLALVVGVTPLTWWVLLLGLFGKGGKMPGVNPSRLTLWGQAPQSAEEWVAAQSAYPGAAPLVSPGGAPQPGQVAVGLPSGQGQSQSAVPGVPAVAQQPGALPAPGLPGTTPASQQPGVPPPGQPAAAQQPSAPPVPGQPAAQQPGAPPVPGQPPQPTDAQQPVPQPGAPQPPNQAVPDAQPPQPGLQQLLATEEKMDINELTDIGDILSSFKDNEDIPDQLLALSQSLGEVELAALVAHTNRVAVRLKAANFPVQRPVHKK